MNFIRILFYRYWTVISLITSLYLPVPNHVKFYPVMHGGYYFFPRNEGTNCLRFVRNVKIKILIQIIDIISLYLQLE